MFVTLSRITTDRYNLLKVSTLSYILMPILTIASLCIDAKSRACQMVALAVQVAQVVNAAWTLNLSIEAFLRLCLYIHTSNNARLFYVCTGCILPGILMCWFGMNPIGAIDDAKSCWSQIENSVIYAVTAINVTMVLISILCLGYTHILYNKEKKKYEPDEWQKFWEELRSVMQFLLADATYWIAGSYATITDDLVAGYVFALASFVFASVVFLSACATNEEMVRAIRIHFEGDEDYKAGLVEVKKTENARFDARRRIRCQVQEHMTKIKQLKKVKQQKEKAKSDAITGMFILAKKQEKRNKVIPVEFEEDFSI
ncbi:uncharacterized protein [Ptychodera flava]|uniref:uncharacterized protein n=1 Tax=Ptychodera flava TaxID=63121 RepID=UPI00396A4343